MYKFFFLVILFFSVTTYAQVGINTRSPQGVFHIDAGVLGDIFDDFIVDSNGYVGIGTLPSSKLHIKSNSIKAFHLDDTSQGDGYVLVSDALGNATWKASPPLLIKTAPLPTSEIPISLSAYTTINTTFLAIDKGIWMISYNFMVKGIAATSGIATCRVRDVSSDQIYALVNQPGNQNKDAVLTQSFILETSSPIKVNLEVNVSEASNPPTPPAYAVNWAVTKFFKAVKLSD